MDENVEKDNLEFSTVLTNALAAAAKDHKRFDEVVTIVWKGIEQKVRITIAPVEPFRK